MILKSINIFFAAFTFIGCLKLSDKPDANSSTISKKHDIPAATIDTASYHFSKPGLPFNSLLHVGIGFLDEKNSKNGLFGDLDESQVHSIEIEGTIGGDRSVINGKNLNLTKIYRHRVTRRDHQLKVKINFLNGSSSTKKFKAKHGDVLWL